MMSKTLPLLLMTSALALAACSGKSKDDVASPSTNPALAVPNGPPAVANPTVGGVPMMATRTIVDNASAAPNLSTLVGAVIALTDVNGNKSYIETADVRQSNGVVHVVNGVIVPKLS